VLVAACGGAPPPVEVSPPAQPDEAAALNDPSEPLPDPEPVELPRRQCRDDAPAGRDPHDGSAGMIATEPIRDVIAAHSTEVGRCYEAELARSPGARGRVTVRFAIAPDGRVSESEIASATFEAPELERCLLEEVCRWAFPSPSGVVTVSYPFEFAP